MVVITLSEIDRKEIVGISDKRRWEDVKSFLKQLVSRTVREDCGYILGIMGAVIDGDLVDSYNLIMTRSEQVIELDPISDFNFISLHQYNDESFVHDQIHVSCENGIIVVIAKYMGPRLDYAGKFDFSIQVDSESMPEFTVTDGNMLNCREMINMFATKTNKAKKRPKKPSSGDISQYMEDPPKSKKKEKSPLTPAEEKMRNAFKRITGKRVIWGGKVTSGYVDWKSRVMDKFRDQGGRATWKNDLTTTFEEYLNEISSDQ